MKERKSKKKEIKKYKQNNFIFIMTKKTKNYNMINIPFLFYFLPFYYFFSFYCKFFNQAFCPINKMYLHFFPTKSLNQSFFFLFQHKCATFLTQILWFLAFSYSQYLKKLHAHDALQQQWQTDSTNYYLFEY